MTVSSSTNKVTYAGNGSTTVFSVGFYFFNDSDLLVVLRDSDGNETVKTLTSDYTVTGAGNPAGGSITMLVAPATGESLVIAREVPLTQQTDYLENDPFPAETHERALDKLTMATQQLQEQVDRSAKLPISDPASADALVADLVRVADSIDNVDTVATDIANVNTTATNIADVNTVAGISGNVTTVAGISANVTAVAGNNANVTTVATNIGNVNTVGGISANVTTVAGISADVVTVAGIDANVTTVAGIAANVTTVAGISASVTAVAADATDIGTVAANLAGADTIGTVAAIDADITAVAAIDTDVTAVAGDAVDIGVVAGQITPTNNISTVAGVAADVATVAGISAAVTTVAADGTDIGVVAGISANVTTVAGISANVTTVAGISADVTAVAADATDIGAVATNIANVNAVAAIDSDVTAVAADATDIGTVAANLAGADTIGTVAGSIANVNLTGGSIANVNTAATNIANINTVATSISNVNAVGTNIAAVNTNATNIAAIQTASANATAAANSATASAASASAASDSADAAATSAETAAAATNAVLWVSGTTYAIGALVYSPVDNRIYRSLSAFTSTTDPSADATNWVQLTRVVEQSDIGTAPNEIPLNQYLGNLAYQNLENLPIPSLDAATTALAGTEVLPIVQSGITKQVSVNNLTTNRTVIFDYDSSTPLEILRDAAGTSLKAINIDQPNTTDGNALGIDYRTSTTGSNVATNEVFVSLRMKAVTHDWSTRQGNLELYLAKGGTGTPKVLTVDPDNLTLNRGNLVIGTAGKGIDFSADGQAAGMTSELLDDYEEGTWTPNQGAGLTVIGDLTTTGRYIKVGNLVTVMANFSATTSVAIASASNFVCTNLPFGIESGFETPLDIQNSAWNANSNAVVSSNNIVSTETLGASAGLIFVLHIK
jgi:hypothetical protein